MWRISHVDTTQTYSVFGQLYYDGDVVTEVDYGDQVTGGSGVAGDYGSFTIQQLNQLYGGGFPYDAVIARHYVAGNGFIAVFQGSEGTNRPLGQISTSGVSASLARAASVTSVINGGSGSDNEEQTIHVEGSGGSFTLTYDGETTGAISFGASAGTVETALEGLSNIGAGNVSVSGTGTSADPYVVEFVSDLATLNLPEMTGDGASLTGGSGSVTESQAHVVGVNEIQIVTLDPTVIGGTFQLRFGGETTTAIAYDASAATVEAALEALDTIDGCSVTGSAGGPWTVTFDTGNVAKRNLSQMTFVDSGLSGGAGTQLMTVTRNIDSLGPNHANDPLNWSLDRVPEYGDDVVWEQGSDSVLYGGVWKQEVEAVDVGTDTADFTLTEHHFVDEQKVRITSTGTLPSGLVDMDYYVRYIDKDTIQLSETRGGSAVSVTDAGTGTHKINVDFNSVRSFGRYTGQIGLSKNNSNNYDEYRPLYMKFGLLGDKKIILGLGEGSGQPRIKFDVDEADGSAKVITTGGSIESGVPTCLFLTDNEAFDLEVLDGDVGVAFHTGEDSTFRKLTQRGGAVKLGAVEFTELDKTAGELITHSDATLNGVMNVNQ